MDRLDSGFHAKRSSAVRELRKSLQQSQKNLGGSLVKIILKKGGRRVKIVKPDPDEEDNARTDQ